MLSRDDPTWMIHFYLGLFSEVGTLLVHCLIFTYFLGTGRWVKEVGLAYDLPDDPLPRLTRALKRRTFPVALAAMLVAIATAGVQQLGGGEAALLDPLAHVVESGRTPARRMLDVWNRMRGDVPKVIGALAY